MLFKKFYAPLCVYVEEMVKSKDDAEDIVQEALMKVWSSGSTFNDENGLKFFLYKSVRNYTVSWLRKNEKPNSLDISLVPDSFDEDAYAAAVREELYNQLHDAIENLPEQQKRVVMMNIEGKTGKEIAAELGLSINTVKVHKQKAMEALKKNAKENALLLLLFADFLFLD